VVSVTTDRERLTADLELLGILADPTRGPLASVYAPPRPKVETNACRVRPIGSWRHSLVAALARFKWVLTTRPASARRLRTNAVPNR
jgi:hypothetical protein